MPKGDWQRRHIARDSLRTSARTFKLMSLLPGVRMFGERLTKPKMLRAEAVEASAARAVRVVKRANIGAGLAWDANECVLGREKWSVQCE